MRSGQYKLSSKGGGECGKRGAVISTGQFKNSYRELPPEPTLSQEEPPPQTDFINLDSLHLSVLKRVDEREESKDGVVRKYKEYISKGSKRRDSILRHKSCENVSVLTRGTVNRVEQKVRSLLRVDSKWNCDKISPLTSDSLAEDTKGEFWQAGRIVTMSKKPRLVSARSHSALHTLSTSSDSASCLSASSGYSSSSSSSSYGSFKSSESVCSSLQRHRNNSSGSQSPTADNNRLMFADNPLYDVMPATSPQINEPYFSLDSSPYESFPSDDLSLKRNPSDDFSLKNDPSNDFALKRDPSDDFYLKSDASDDFSLKRDVPITDPIAKQCIEYFEKRLTSSETLRRKWSLFIYEPPEKYNQINSDLISKGDAIIDSKFNSGFDSNLAVESNFLLSEEEHSEDSSQKTQKKNELDLKMELLRQEIASLILQDNSLFHQLLTLHNSISNLKVQSALSSFHCGLVNTGANDHGFSLGSNPQSDLESFTEEEEIEEESETELQPNFYNEENTSPEPNEQEKICLRTEEESLRTHEDSLRTHEDSLRTHEESLRTHEESFPFCEDKPSAKLNDEDEDEGHGTDLSLGDTPSNSSSPASTLSSNSSEGISYSRNLYSEMTSEFSGSFTRCRKSYAPTARNRRRSSSVNRQKSPSLECGTTTALVVIYADDEDLLLNSSRPRSHSFTPLTTYDLHDALNYSGHNDNLKTMINDRTTENTSLPSLKNDKELQEVSPITLISCSSLTGASSSISVASRTNSHPPYREALIM